MVCNLFLFADLADFRVDFAKAKHIAIITGAGVSAESGVPTFRGQGGYWRKWQAQVTHTVYSTSHIFHYLVLVSGKDLVSSLCDDPLCW